MINLYPDKQAGMGLIETLLILLFVSIGIVALVNYQHYLSYSADNAQQQFDATILANKQLETMRDFQVMSTTVGYSAYADIASGTSNVTLGNTAYAVAWTVTTNTSPAYKTINVTVTWTNRFSNSQSVQLSSRVAGVDPAAAVSIK